jgi:hypothetical protein
MCCFLASLALFGPRLAFLVYWLLPIGRLKISAAFDGWFWPIIGLIVAPWTILAYSVVFPVYGFDWVWVGLGVVADIAGYVAGASRRTDVSWYTGP